MKISRKILIIVLLGVFWFIRGENETQITTDIHFTYLTEESNGITIHKINPVTGLVDESITVPSIAGQVAEAKISPSGEWLSLVLTVQTENHIQIISTITGEQRLVAESVVLSPPPNGFIGEIEYVQWSHNSENLAYSVVDNFSSQIYSYALSGGQTVAVNTTNSEQHRFSWSSNSQTLAVVTTNCVSIFECNESIEIVDVLSNNTIKSVSIANLLLGQQAEGASACRLEWSPNGNQIMFMAGCDGSALGDPREVYIYNINNDSIVSVTNFTQAGRNGLLPYLVGNYEMTWIGNDRIIINATYREIEGPFTTRTLLYNIDNESIQVLTSTTSLGSQISPNLMSVAMTPITFNTELQPQIATLMVYEINDPSNVENLGVASCDYEWSPEQGTYLMYTIRSDVNAFCTTPIQTLIFRNMNTSQEISVDIPNTKTFLLGWISAPSDPISCDATVPASDVPD